MDSKCWGSFPKDQWRKIKLIERVPTCNDLSKGRRYYFEISRMKPENNLTKTKEDFETHFDVSANGTSFRSKHNSTIFQGDATCLPLPLKEIKETLKMKTIDCLSTELLEDESAEMLEEFISGLEIERIRIKIPSDLAKSSCRIQKYINKTDKFNRVDITIKVPRDFESESSSTLITLIARKSYLGDIISRQVFGFDATRIRNFIRGIRPLESIGIELSGNDNHSPSSVLTKELLLELHMNHKHVKLANILNSSFAETLIYISEIQIDKDKSWRSFQVKASLNLVRLFLQRLAISNFCDGQLQFFPKAKVKYFRKGVSHCFFYQRNAAFVSAPLQDDAIHCIGIPLNRDIFELRIECNIDTSNHWAIENPKQEMKKKKKWYNF